MTAVLQRWLPWLRWQDSPFLITVHLKHLKQFRLHSRATSQGFVIRLNVYRGRNLFISLPIIRKVKREKKKKKKDSAACVWKIRLFLLQECVPEQQIFICMFVLKIYSTLWKAQYNTSQTNKSRSEIIVSTILLPYYIFVTISSWDLCSE